MSNNNATGDDGGQTEQQRNARTRRIETVRRRRHSRRRRRTPSFTQFAKMSERRKLISDQLHLKMSDGLEFSRNQNESHIQNSTSDIKYILLHHFEEERSFVQPQQRQADSSHPRRRRCYDLLFPLLSFFPVDGIGRLLSSWHLKITRVTDWFLANGLELFYHIAQIGSGGHWHASYGDTVASSVASDILTAWTHEDRIETTDNRQTNSSSNIVSDGQRQTETLVNSQCESVSASPQAVSNNNNNIAESSSGSSQHVEIEARNRVIEESGTAVGSSSISVNNRRQTKDNQEKLWTVKLMKATRNASVDEFINRHPLRHDFVTDDNSSLNLFKMCFICLEDNNSSKKVLYPCCSQCSAVTHLKCWERWRRSQKFSTIRSRLLATNVTNPLICAVCKSGHAQVPGEKRLRWTVSTSQRLRKLQEDFLTVLARMLHDPHGDADSFICSWELVTLNLSLFIVSMAGCATLLAVLKPMYWGNVVLPVLLSVYYSIVIQIIIVMIVHRRCSLGGLSYRPISFHSRYESRKSSVLHLKPSQAHHDAVLDCWKLSSVSNSERNSDINKIASLMKNSQHHSNTDSRRISPSGSVSPDQPDNVNSSHCPSRDRDREGDRIFRSHFVPHIDTAELIDATNKPKTLTVTSVQVLNANNFFSLDEDNDKDDLGAQSSSLSSRVPNEESSLEGNRTLELNNNCVVVDTACPSVPLSSSLSSSLPSSCKFSTMSNAFTESVTPSTAPPPSGTKLNSLVSPLMMPTKFGSDRHDRSNTRDDDSRQNELTIYVAWAGDRLPPHALVV